MCINPLLASKIIDISGCHKNSLLLVVRDVHRKYEMLSSPGGVSPLVYTKYCATQWNYMTSVLQITGISLFIPRRANKVPSRLHCHRSKRLLAVASSLPTYRQIWIFVIYLLITVSLKQSLVEQWIEKLIKVRSRLSILCRAYGRAFGSWLLV